MSLFHQIGTQIQLVHVMPLFDCDCKLRHFNFVGTFPQEWVGDGPPTPERTRLFYPLFRNTETPPDLGRKTDFVEFSLLNIDVGY